MAIKDPVDTKQLSCAKCGHSWECRGDEPERCANQKCRSKAWRDGRATERAPRVVVVLKDAEQLEQFKRAARGESVGDWLRDLGAAVVAPPGRLEPKVNFPVPEVRESLDIGRDPGFGRSVTEFLLNAQPMIALTAKVADAPEGDEWEARCQQEFGAKVMSTAAKAIPRWGKLAWKQRYDALVEKREREQGEAW